MKWLRKWLKLRRQNDYVKIMFLILIAGIFMIGSGIYNGIAVYHSLKTPGEYILSASSETMTSENINKLLELKGVNAVTPQRNVDLTVNNTEKGESFACCQISENYLKDVYQVYKTGGMKTFYLTPKAYKKVMAGSDNSKTQEREIQLNYQMGEEEQGIAKFVLLDSALLTDEEIAFCAGTSVDFSKDCNEVRVHIVQKDLDGTLIRHIETLGYGLENQDVVQAETYELDQNFLKIKYDLAIGVLCIFFSIIIRKMLKI